MLRAYALDKRIILVTNLRKLKEAVLSNITGDFNRKQTTTSLASDNDTCYKPVFNLDIRIHDKRILTYECLYSGYL